MPDLGKAYVQIVPSAEGITGSISKLLGGESESAGREAGSSIGKNLVSVLKTVVAAAGIKEFLQASLNAGGAIQQSFGGIDTLYDSAGDAAKRYANDAYKAGISANTYAEQAVSFGAALKKAYGGDVAKAAEAANTAIMDMADNSAKMGTNIQSIQDAYQGFAKQNYTMLDNLKLGYGGTKTEMERLLEDANKINAAQGKITDYSIDNLGDVYEAIHVIQGDLKLTGTAVEEAKTTFTGSFGAMKASAENFMAALSLGTDITEPLNNLVDTTVNFVANNLLPMIGNIAVQLPKVIIQAVKTYGPAFAQSGVEMINNIANGLAEGIPNFLANALPMVGSFCSSLRENAGQLIEAGLNLIVNLAQGIANSLPVLIQNIPQIVIDICGIINDNMPKVLVAGGQFIIILVQGIIESIPVLIENIGMIWEMIKAVWQAIDWISLGTNMIQWIGNGIQALFTHVPNLLRNIGTGAVSLFKGIPWKEAGSWIIEILKSGMEGLAHLIPNALKAIGMKAKDVFLNINWIDLGRKIIDGIASGIINAVGSLVSAAINACKSLVNGVKDFFGIHSPSRLMANEVGQWLPAGIAVGIEDNMSSVQDAMDNVNSELKGQVNASVSRGVYPGNYGAGFNQSITINAPTELDPSEIARQTRNATREYILAMKGV